MGNITSHVTGENSSPNIAHCTTQDLNEDHSQSPHSPEDEDISSSSGKSISSGLGALSIENNASSLTVVTAREQDSATKEDVSTPMAAAAIATLLATRDSTERNPTEGSSDTNYKDTGHTNRDRSTSLLKDLCIEEITSLRFGVKDILSISRSAIYQEESKTLKDKILFVISKIIIGDCSPDNMLLCTNRSQEAGDSGNITENDDDEDDDDLFSIIQHDSEFQKVKQTQLHPSDVIVIIMNCCDNILKQILITKMVKCQMAIPLSFPNLFNNEQMFLLWALRHLNLEWTTKPTGVHKENPVEFGIPIVSAIRLGDLAKSKSLILNGILCNGDNNIFFHKDCNGGDLSRKLSNGVIELAWYLPGYGKDESFNDIWAIANQRGDALKYSLQFDLINKVSSVMLIFLTKESLDHSFDILEKLSVLNQQLIFVFLDVVSPVTDKNQKQIEKENFRKLMTLMNNKIICVRESVNGKKKNVASINMEIKDRIKESLLCIKTGNSIGTFTLKQVSDIAKDIGINVDESTEHCRKGKELADIVRSILDSSNTEDRNKILPLQGEIWSEWSRLSKQQARRKGAEGMSPEDFDSEIYHKKKICREQQFKRVQNMLKEMEKLPLFMKQNEVVIYYFLKWMKFNLDATSNKLLPKLLSNYHEVWENIQKKTIKEDNDSERLENLEKKISSASFGLEHFMREIGQVFEASFHQKKTEHYKTLLNNLPMCAADLLIAGFPLEIMDGDACHIPTIWLEAVFEALTQKLKDERVYVISVLGIQSSGKSTLLNTMFGFNFPVSAGRCTKGVFAQLISVDEHLVQELGFEHILVLDTEGLRSSEIGNRKRWHDNEIATLVIAMGDITIVNLKGENTSEIEDILQISVHAFIRMSIANNNTKLKPGCYFVHQNVSDVAASRDMLFSYERLKKTLDNISVAAGEHEGASEIRSFNDVIEFNINQQIWYFPNLWKGDPPMAPINLRYSEKAFDLKKHILRYPSEKNIICSKFSDLKNRTSYIWKAILSENFVFSFKNHLEIKCFAILEKEILSIFLDFRNKINEKKHCYKNKIDNCEEKNLSSYQITVNREMRLYIGECHSIFIEQLENFIKLDREKDIIEQWKFGAKRKIDNLNEELINETENNLNIVFQLCKAKYDQNRQMVEYRDEIKEFVGQIASTTFDSEMDDESLKIEFEEKWDEWIEGLSFRKIEHKTNIPGNVMEIFKTLYATHHAIWSKFDLYNEKVQYCNLDTIPIPTIENKDFTIYEENYIINTSQHDVENDVNESMYFFGAETQINEIEGYTDSIMKEVDMYLKNIKDQDYDNHFLYALHEKFSNMIQNFEKEYPQYKLTIWFQVKVFAHILKYAIPHFELMHSEYLKRLNPKNILTEKYKPQAYEIFKGTYKQNRKEKTAANILKDFLLKAIYASMKDPLSGNITNILKASHAEFQSKNELCRKVMQDLRKLENLDKYIMYIWKPQRSLESWIKKYVSDYCMKRDLKGKSILGNKANEIFRYKVTQLKECVKKASESNEISFEDWLQKFKNAAEKIISFSDTLFNVFDMKEVEVNDFNYFKKELIKSLEDLKTSQEKILDNYELKELNSVNKQPHILICESILGCMEQCPFCGVICSHTLEHPGKDHMAPLHYPKGLRGGHWIDSTELVLKSCNEDVAGDKTFRCPATDMNLVKFKDYKSVNDYHASWSIAADTSLEPSLYWKWVLAQFTENFLEYYSKKFNKKIKCTKIPSEWKNIKEEEVDESIRIMFQ